MLRGVNGIGSMGVAAYGVLVMVFQWGWFDSVTGFDSLGYVQAITPALLLAVAVLAVVGCAHLIAMVL